MTDTPRFVRVDFYRFKAFEKFTLYLRNFNVLVGPNNAGKSTILTAFRILAAAMRVANSRKPVQITGPHGQELGYIVDLSAISVAEENIFFNYEDSSPATVEFQLSNKNKMLLYFPEQGRCNLILDAQGTRIFSPTQFRKEYKCPIGFVPILGPVEHSERLLQITAARNALINYQAARNFRNIWYHYPDSFNLFRQAINETWPGMDIEQPKIEFSGSKSFLSMFCIEGRMPRELYWAGFGFQVWCQMLTHLIQSKNVALFLIDEPDIYLHSNLQRQLIGVLSNLGPDILIATHSIEIISEAETDDIVLVDKHRKFAQRIKQPSKLGRVFSALGSNLNPVLTQLAKTRRAVFVEGKDFKILSRFARKLKELSVANQSDFAVIPVEGFNPERVRSVKIGIETTLGIEISAATVLDRDYRSDSECRSLVTDCETFCDYVYIHNRKEIENYLLVPEALNRAIARKSREQSKRTGKVNECTLIADVFLGDFSKNQKQYVTAQSLHCAIKFSKKHSPEIDESKVTEKFLGQFEASWNRNPFDMIPGKKAISEFNKKLQDKCGVNLTITTMIDAMRTEEIPTEVIELIKNLENFATRHPD
ncbi:MAG: AAA family ATPase [Gammaproteobacteria bacterium]|nr:AAA family ATPase [Gammaproteobacteria bacterium]MYG68381.1 AAA family ATPase [Gammaproteobacteria bacterium]